MIIQQNIELSELDKQGKEYPFKRPEICIKCSSSKVWGHGYVERYFDGYYNRLYFKRWICADCGCVLSIRPYNYFSRHHCSIKKIADCIRYRLRHGYWIRGPDLSRQRQGHWLFALKRNIHIFLGLDWTGNILEGFQKLISISRCPILRPT